MAGGGQTLAEAAFLQLRQQLLSATLAPGAPLRLEKLKQDLGIGFTPLREALMRLTSEGLVEAEEQRGFRVAAATLADLEDIMRTRADIEALALTRAIEIGDHDWEALIVAAFHRMSRKKAIDAETGLISAEWDEAHRAFHLSLIEACDSRWLKRFWTTLFDQAQRYRQIAVTRGTPYRSDLAEHQRLMEATLARDLPAALRASRAHIESTRDVVCKIVAEIKVD